MHPKPSPHNGKPKAADPPSANVQVSSPSTSAGLVEDNAAFRSRLEREHARVVEAEKANLAQVLLASIDDLERTLAAVADTSLAKNHALGHLAQGVRLSMANLEKGIADMGAVRMSTVGLRFDPVFSEAVDVVSVTDPDLDGVIVEEVRPGYRVGERILRPAQVRVGQLPRR